MHMAVHVFANLLFLSSPQTLPPPLPPSPNLLPFGTICLICVQAEKFRAKAQRPEQSRSHTQYCRYLYYLGRIKAIQLEYTDARDYLQQAARKVSLSVNMRCP